jgi:hypothetical protein
MPTLLRIDAALSTCGSHIEDLKKQAPFVDAATLSKHAGLENYLVGFLVGAIYAEFEQYVRKVILERCEGIPDRGLKTFARNYYSHCFTLSGHSGLVA